MVPGPTPILRFEAQGGVAYAVRARVALADGPWLPVVTVPAGDARLVEIPIPATDDARFLQVMAGP